MQIKQDKYNVAQSKIVNIVGRGSDIRLDMQLDFNNKQTNIGSSITGKVVDSNNNPIKGAVIKLVDGNFQPLTNTMTDDNGNYFINSLPFSNIYKIIATAIGKIVFQTEPVTLLLGEYGYYFKIYHMEPWRVLISGNVAHAPTDLSLGFNNIDLNTVKLYIESNGLQYVTLSKLYHIDFSTAQNSGNWQSKIGSANITLENNILNINTVESIIIDDNAPMLDNGVYEATFKYTSNDENHGRIGLVFRYVDSNDWAAICYDIDRYVDFQKENILLLEVICLTYK